MLRLNVQLTQEGWNEETEEFVEAKTQVLDLEHSLVSISKWESKWHKSFIHTKNLTREETLDYVKYMTLTKNVKPEVYDHLSDDDYIQIRNYIDNPMTATTFTEDKNAKNNREIVTAELIYYWMIALNIPFECQKWHLNRLLTLIRVCNIKNQPPKKMGKQATLNQYASLNAARKAKMNTKG